MTIRSDRATLTIDGRTYVAPLSFTYDPGPGTVLRSGYHYEGAIEGSVTVTRHGWRQILSRLIRPKRLSRRRKKIAKKRREQYMRAQQEITETYLRRLTILDEEGDVYGVLK